MTRSVCPVPKLRVTRRSCGAPRSQAAQSDSGGIDRNDVEDARETDFDDGLCFTAVERDAADDDFRFIGLLVLLPFDNGASKNDVLKIEDCEAIILHLLRSVERDGRTAAP